METVLAQLIGGAAGGMTVKGSDLSDIGNLIAGAVGGVVDGSLLGVGGGAGGVGAGSHLVRYSVAYSFGTRSHDIRRQ